jgi:lipoprotein-releasing system ATP-binding protein
MSNVLELVHIHKEFEQGGESTHVLEDVSLQVKKGEVLALVGQSGSGKTTLLHIAAMLAQADSGEIRINGDLLANHSDKAMAAMRNQTLGFVYQTPNLLPEFTALENVMLPCVMAEQSKKNTLEKSNNLLSKMDLGDRKTHFPSQLSGGQQQRVAIARALVNDPALLIADEPTGSLDEENADRVFDLLMKIVREKNLAVLIATHNMELTKKMDRIITLKEGKIEE